MEKKINVFGILTDITSTSTSTSTSTGPCQNDVHKDKVHGSAHHVLQRKASPTSVCGQEAAPRHRTCCLLSWLPGIVFLPSSTKNHVQSRGKNDVKCLFTYPPYSTKHCRQLKHMQHDTQRTKANGNHLFSRPQGRQTQHMRVHPSQCASKEVLTSVEEDLWCSSQGF